jgi:hypothetical protein
MEQSASKYPQVVATIDCRAPEGNAFAVIGSLTKAARKARLTTAEIAEFQNEAFACKSYEQLLTVCEKYFAVTFTNRP